MKSTSGFLVIIAILISSTAVRGTIVFEDDLKILGWGGTRKEFEISGSGLIEMVIGIHPTNTDRSAESGLILAVYDQDVAHAYAEDLIADSTVNLLILDENLLNGTYQTDIGSGTYWFTIFNEFLLSADVTVSIDFTEDKESFVPIGMFAILGAFIALTIITNRPGRNSELSHSA